MAILVESQILYELGHRQPVLWVIPIENILGKLPVVHVRVGHTGTITHHLRNDFPGAGAAATRCPQARCAEAGEDAGCGLCGPVICNEWEGRHAAWRKVPSL